MSKSAITVPVAEAAKDFLRLLDRIERLNKSAILLRKGWPVATLSPLPGAALTCAELADRWPNLDKLPPEEADVFADDLERAHAGLPSLKTAWD